MSEPIWCNVSVRYPTSWGERPWFIDQLADALINGVDEQGADEGIWCIEGEGNYGLYDDEVQAVLDWMTDNRVPFVAHSDAKYEFEADHWIYDGAADNIHRFTGDSSRIMIDENTWRRITTGKHPEHRTMEEFWDAANRCINDLSIDHLPAELPADPDAEEDEE